MFLEPQIEGFVVQSDVSINDPIASRTVASSRTRRPTGPSIESVRVSARRRPKSSTFAALAEASSGAPGHWLAT